MPIVSIDIVTKQPPAAHLTGELANSLAGVFGGPPARTWVRLQPVEHYAEGGDGPPAGVRPVFVSVLMANPPLGSDRERLVAEIAAAVSATCDRPRENVHVVLEAPGAGRVAFGGEMVPESDQ